MTGDSLFPPRCCRQPITTGSVRVFLTAELVMQCEQKKIELDTPDRTYCSNLCSAFIRLEDITDEQASCPDCGTVTCTLCKATSHGVLYDAGQPKPFLETPEPYKIRPKEAKPEAVVRKTRDGHIQPITDPAIPKALEPGWSENPGANVQKRSSTAAKREQSVSRKHTKDEDEMVLDEDLELIRAKLAYLKLRKGGRFHIKRPLRMKERVFCCSCENVTGVSEEFACVSCKHTRCAMYLAMR